MVPNKTKCHLVSFGVVPKQMLFGNLPTRPKQMGPNEIITFGSKPKQLTFGNWLASTNQSEILFISEQKIFASAEGGPHSRFCAR